MEAQHQQHKVESHALKMRVQDLEGSFADATRDEEVTSSHVTVPPDRHDRVSPGITLAGLQSKEPRPRPRTSRSRLCSHRVPVESALLSAQDLRSTPVVSG